MGICRKSEKEEIGKSSKAENIRNQKKQEIKKKW